MTYKVPLDIRDKMREQLWAKADGLVWTKLSDVERASWYENWAKDKEIGGVLSHFMDPRLVRVYIKDSLLKPYTRRRLESTLTRVLKALEVPLEVSFKEAYEKPHGRMLLDGRVLCWGNSRDWKTVLFAVFERAYRRPEGRPYAAMLLETGKSAHEGTREMIRNATDRLGIERLIWFD